MTLAQITLKGIVPSAHQIAIGAAVVHTQDHIQVQATAGAGKSWTLEWLCEVISQNMTGKVLVCAFNRDIAQELSARLRRFGNVECKTINSLGNSILNWRRNGRVQPTGKRMDLDPRKLQTHAAKRCKLDPHTGRPTETEIFSDLCTLCEVACSQMIDPADSMALLAAVRRQGKALRNGDAAFDRLPALMLSLQQDTTCFDFREQTYLPVALDMAAWGYDFVLVDEAQDLNECQMQLISKVLKRTGRLITVGDRWQSIYGFRGADPAAMDELRDRFSMRRLTLPVTFRCPAAVVRCAQAIADPSIIVAADNAAEGIVEDRSEEDYDRTIAELEADDLVLCRANAPLVGPALQLIAEGRKATIKGKDIGRTLITIIRDLKPRGLRDLATRLDKWLDKELKKAEKDENYTLAALREDQYDVLTMLIRNTEGNRVEDVTSKIDAIFQEDVRGVVFSSIHKSKGLEADRVVLLAPELLPHPMACKSTDPVMREQNLQQEKNLHYVAVTRSKDTLITQPLPDDY